MTIRPYRRMLAISLSVLACLGVSYADENPFEDVLAALTEQLELSEDQQAEVGNHLMVFGQSLEAATQEAEAEEPDAQKMMGDVKKARNEFKKSMEKTLDKDQFAALEAHMEATIQGMFNDLAAIKIMDLQPVLELTDDQAVELEPIISTGLRGMLSLVFENSDKRLTPPRKISLGRSMKKIQSDMEKGIASVLTEAQMQKYQAMKEAAKS